MSQDESEPDRELRHIQEDRAARRGNPWDGCASSGCAGWLVATVALAAVVAAVM